MNIKVAIFPNSEVRSSLIFSTISLAISSVLIFIVLSLIFAVKESGVSNSDTSQFYTITKPIGISNTIFGSSSSFNEGEIETIREQDFLENMSFVRKSSFLCRASFFENNSFRSEIIIESLPEKFMDGPVYKFYWEEGVSTVPIIISAQFLQLYNLVYAPVAGLPPVSAENLSLVPVRLTLQGENRSKIFDAEIIGLSNRFNGIFVPDNFLKNANAELSGKSDSRKDKLIVQLDSRFMNEFENYVEKKGYEINNEQLRIGKTLSLVFPLLYGLLTLFIAIVILSVSNFWLQWKWILEEQKRNISILYFLGVDTKQLSRTVFFKLSPYLITSFLASMILGSTFFYLLQPILKTYIDSSSHLPIQALSIFSLAYLIIFTSIYLLLHQFSRKAYA